GLEVGSIRHIQGLDMAYWGFLGVYWSSGYGVLSFFPLLSLVSPGTDTPYLP
ncbi:hypothetical protein Tco_0857736, partial [Tanacetum coccineum]